MKFYIIIPVYNNKRDTLECLRLLSIQSFQDFSIFVIDTDSQDGTIDAIRKKFPEVSVIEESSELWWTGAINAGLKEALVHAKDDDYVLTLNNDVVFKEDYLENLSIAASLRPGWLIGSISLDKDENRCSNDAGVYFDWRTRQRIKGNFKPGQFFNEHVNVLSGRGALIPIRVYKKIGFYNEHRLPHYAADYELAVRAQNNAFKVCVFYGAVLINDTTVSGYKYTPFTRLTRGEAREILFSNKSNNQIRTRVNFTLLCCPKKYLLWNLTCELFGILQVVSSIAPLWYIKILFRPAAKYLFQSTK